MARISINWKIQSNMLFTCDEKLFVLLKLLTKIFLNIILNFFKVDKRNIHARKIVFTDIFMFHQYCIPKTTYFSIIMLAIPTVLTDVTQTVEVACVGIVCL